MPTLEKVRWRSDLEAASSDADIGRIARLYLAAITPEELMRLPDPCQSGPLENHIQVAECAVRLAREDLRLPPDGDGTALVRDMSEFFAAALHRLAALHARENRH